jgi:hypothetical protein
MSCFSSAKEAGLELGAIVRLDDQHPKGEPRDDLVYEPDGRQLVAGIVDLEHSNARTVVDSGELVEAVSWSQQGAAAGSSS